MRYSRESNKAAAISSGYTRMQLSCYYFLLLGVKWGREEKVDPYSSMKKFHSSIHFFPFEHNAGINKCAYSETKRKAFMLNLNNVFSFFLLLPLFICFASLIYFVTRKICLIQAFMCGFYVWSEWLFVIE